jgi:hypothetical protein
MIDVALPTLLQVSPKFRQHPRESCQALAVLVPMGLRRSCLNKEIHVICRVKLDLDDALQSGKHDVGGTVQEPNQANLEPDQAIEEPPEASQMSDAGTHPTGKQIKPHTFWMTLHVLDILVPTADVLKRQLGLLRKMTLRHEGVNTGMKEPPAAHGVRHVDPRPTPLFQLPLERVKVTTITSFWWVVQVAATHGRLLAAPDIIDAAAMGSEADIKPLAADLRNTVVMFPRFFIAVSPTLVLPDARSAPGFLPCASHARS